MAGQPKKRAILAELQRRAIDELGEGGTIGDYAVAWIESGRTMVKLAAEIERAIGIEVLASQVSKLIHEHGDKGALSEARREGAHALAGESIEIVDNAPETREALQKAKLQAETRQWLAKSWNREAFGEQRGTNVSISFGDLHLQAMRVRALPQTEQQAALPASVADDAQHSDSAQDVSFEVLAD